jgi:transcriptional regulator with XRE-family HTH domain
MKREGLIAFRSERSQEQMAALYGVTQQAWCKWENGDGKPNVVTMKKMEDDSGVPMTTLFADVFNNHKL